MSADVSLLFSKDVFVFELGPVGVVVVFLAKFRVRGKVSLRFHVFRVVAVADALQENVSFDVVKLCGAERDDRVRFCSRRLEHVLN